MHKWATNYNELRDFVSTQSRPSDVKSTEDETYVKTELRASEKYCKVFGINWYTNTGSFVTDFDSSVADAFYETVTKKNILKFSASFLDPLGLASPWVLPSKVFFKN